MRNVAGRRQTLALGLSAAAAAPLALGPTRGAAQSPALPEIRGKTYVLVHGSWGGGWQWAPVAERLRAQGHRVFTPTQTGLGERRHLLSRDITIDTFVEDIVNVIGAEELRDVILVGHSFGGVPVTGVVDRMPGHIRHLVYLDAAIVQGGQSFFGSYPPEVAAARRKAAQEGGNGIAVPVPPIEALSGIGVPPGPLAEWMHRRLTPHPIGTYETPLKLSNPVGNGRPCTYVHFNSPPFAPMEASRRWARGQQGWSWTELATSHNGLITVPDEVTRLLAGIG
jgi:pimeloyl-ACP methyl ester carboxylesterase